MLPLRPWELASGSEALAKWGVLMECVELLLPGTAENDKMFRTWNFKHSKDDAKTPRRCRRVKLENKCSVACIFTCGMEDLWTISSYTVCIYIYLFFCLLIVVLSFWNTVLYLYFIDWLILTWKRFNEAESSEREVHCLKLAPHTQGAECTYCPLRQNAKVVWRLGNSCIFY